MISRNQKQRQRSFRGVAAVRVARILIRTFYLLGLDVFSRALFTKILINLLIPTTDAIVISEVSFIKQIKSPSQRKSSFTPEEMAKEGAISHIVGSLYAFSEMAVI